MATAAAAHDLQDAARRAAAARCPLWFAAGAEPRALGAGTRRGGFKFLAWTEDNLLRQVVYEGLREDKPAREGRREVEGRSLNLRAGPGGDGD